MTVFDIIIVSVLLFSSVIALMRGLTREVLTIGSWAGAAFLTFFVTPILAPILRNILPGGFREVANILSIAISYVALVSVLGIVNHNLCKMVQKSALGPIDRAFGLVFGFLRAGLFVVAFFMVAEWAGDGTPPEWMKNAVTTPYIKIAADQSKAMVTKWYQPEKQNNDSQGFDIGRFFPDMNFDTQEETKTNVPSGSGQKSESGYDQDERQSLDALIENTN